MKYYVTLGKFHKIFQAGNPYQACIKTLQLYLNNGLPSSIPGLFRVSQQGHDEHDDDLIIELSAITDILYKIANPEDSNLSDNNSFEEENGIDL